MLRHLTLFPVSGSHRVHLGHLQDTVHSQDTVSVHGDTKQESLHEVRESVSMNFRAVSVFTVAAVGCVTVSGSNRGFFKVTGKSNLPRMVAKFVCFVGLFISKHREQY